jgi:hypothetical protein
MILYYDDDGDAPSFLHSYWERKRSSESYISFADWLAEYGGVHSHISNEHIITFINPADEVIFRLKYKL